MKLDDDSKSTMDQSDEAKPGVFALLLRRHRLAAGLSQEALAEQAGLSADAVGMLERGVRRMPYEQTIESLASALALSRKDRDNLRSACRRRVSAGTQHFGTRARLPVPLTPLIGRTHDLMVVRSWFASGGPRLSTITGTAGVGKTRFALALAHDLRRQFAAEVVFVSLAALQEPANIASAIVARLDRTDDGTPASLETLCAYVADRRVLFVLDNLEHVLSGVAAISEFLERCPRAVVLATSREALRIHGEHEFVLQPLEIEYAVELFVERGRALQPQLHLDRGDERLIRICKRLDCLPLAIELAAARLRWESVETLLDQVSSPLSALIFGERDAPPRQRTIRATIDWSYRLLTEQERTVFSICALFPGAGPVEAIGAIAKTTDSFTGIAMHVVMALADKHLLRLDKSDLRTARFEMLDVIRGYAREQLNSLEHSNRYERAFAVYYVDILRRDARSREDAAGASRWIELVATEYMNICAALRWSVDNDRSIGLQLALALPEFWERKGLYAEARRWLEALLDPIDATIEREDPIVAWRAVNALALSYYWTAEAKRACSLHKRALAMTRSYDDPSMTAKSLNNLGIALLETGEAEQARSVLEEALAIKEDREGAWSVASTVGNLGIALRMCRDYKQALKCHERARELFRSIADAWGEAGELNFLGDVYCDCHQYRKAVSCYTKSLEINTEGIRPLVAHSLEGLIAIAASRRKFWHAAVLVGAVDRIRNESGQPVSPSALARFEMSRAAALASLGDYLFAEASNRGAELSFEDVIDFGRAVDARSDYRKLLT